jgi:23S rRNA (uracil1939-C5)-methyltransferase
VKLRIEKSVYGGAGLARAADGKTVFVPLVLPGESVSVAVTQDKRSFAEAELLEVLEPAPERVAAPCPYFGRCGGCQYQHASYPAQLEIKEQVLRESLGRARVSAPARVQVHAGEPWGYRNRIRLHVRAEDGALGYRERGSHRLLVVEQCPIAMPVLERALRAVTEALRAQRLGDVFAEAELSTDDRGDAVCLLLELRAGTRATEQVLAAVCARVSAQLPELRGAGVRAAAPQREPGRRSGRGPSDEDEQAPASRLLATWGEPWLTHGVLGQEYTVSLGAFFQVHHGLVAKLVTLATSERAGRLAWDLYAGVGLFSRALAPHFAQVVAVEGAPVSAANLRQNLLAPHRAVEASTLAFLERERLGLGVHVRRAAGATPEFVLVDPPRAGLGEEASRLLSEIGPEDITYVSCDPATLGRDLRVLLDSGYQLEQLHLVDLFPQTFHVEAVAKLRRRV